MKSVIDYGAIGDGITDDSAAIQRCTNAGGGYFPPYSYRINTQLRLRSNTTLYGPGAKIFAGRRIGGMFLCQDMASNILIDSMSFSCNEPGNYNYVLTVLSGRNITLNSCNFLGSITTGHLVDFNANDFRISDIRVTNCYFADTMHSLRLRGQISEALISRNYFRSWFNYAIFLNGTKSFAPQDIIIQDNKFETPMPGIGGARQMIVTYFDKGVINIWFKRINILYNHCVGPGEYTNKIKPANNAGTSDQISLNWVDGFNCSGNYSWYGGENGITVSNFSKNGSVIGNDCRENDGHAIQVSSRNERCKNIVVELNHCLDNGLRRDPFAQGKMAGIYSQDGDDIRIGRNHCISTMIPRTVEYGIIVTESSNVDAQLLKTNIIRFADSNGAVGLYTNQNKYISPIFNRGEVI